MTSRRTFLGLLALVPAAAPSVIEAAARPRYARGVTGSAFLSPVTPGAFVGEGAQDFPLSPSQSRAFLKAMQPASEPNNALRRLMRSEAPWDVPNRLYGSEINDEGDVI